MSEKPRNEKPTCCGVIEQSAREAREKSEARRSKPQPWIVKKFAVGLTFGIIGYATYVFIGRLCVPMIRRESPQSVMGPPGVTAVYLVIFGVLLFMSLWAYIKTIMTSPGYARDFAKPNNAATVEAGPQYIQAPGPISPLDKPQAGITTAIPAIVIPEIPELVNPIAEQGPMSNKPQRRPPEIPILSVEQRFCYKEEFVRPPRSHHCRACGTCVLLYDHHCPWIGQCVGARNHKFFVNFLQWIFLYCAFLFAILVASLAKAPDLNTNGPDPQIVVIVALSAIFMLFTGTLLYSHIALICLNQSSVETFNFRLMRERESFELAKTEEFGGIWDCNKRRHLIREWDRDWGRIGLEGNVWWLGSHRKNWEAVMGKPISWWFLPIGKSDGDGSSFPVNPRFDSLGRWMPRNRWPSEIQ